MTASSNAFSWTCQPNINEVKPHNIRHLTNPIGLLIDFQSLYKHGWKEYINILASRMIIIIKLNAYYLAINLTIVIIDSFLNIM